MDRVKEYKRRRGFIEPDRQPTNRELLEMDPIIPLPESSGDEYSGQSVNDRDEEDEEDDEDDESRSSVHSSDISSSYLSNDEEDEGEDQDEQDQWTDSENGRRSLRSKKRIKRKENSQHHPSRIGTSSTSTHIITRQMSRTPTKKRKTKRKGQQTNHKGKKSTRSTRNSSSRRRKRNGNNYEDEDDDDEDDLLLNIDDDDEEEEEDIDFHGDENDDDGDTEDWNDTQVYNTSPSKRKRRLTKRSSQLKSKPLSFDDDYEEEEEELNITSQTENELEENIANNINDEDDEDEDDIFSLTDTSRKSKTRKKKRKRSQMDTLESNLSGNRKMKKIAISNSNGIGNISSTTYHSRSSSSISKQNRNSMKKSKNSRHSIKRGQKNTRVVDNDDGDQIEVLSNPVPWVSTSIPHSTPYLPQIGDIVVYFQQGHDAFIQRLKEIGIPGVDSKDLIKIFIQPSPWMNGKGKFPQLDTIMAQVESLEFQIIPNTTVVYAMMTLSYLESFIEPIDSPVTIAFPLDPTRKRYLKLTSQRIQLHFFDLEGSDDFVILLKKYEKGISQTFSIGDCVNVLYTGDEMYKGIIADIRQESHNEWLKYGIQWPSSEEIETKNSSKNNGYDHDDDVDELALPSASFSSFSSSSPIEYFSPWMIRPILHNNEKGKEKITSQEFNPDNYRDTLSEHDKIMLVNGIKNLIAKPIFQDFVEPIDYHEIFFYLQFIAYPMYLELILERLLNNYYRRIEVNNFLIFSLYFLKFFFKTQIVFYEIHIHRRFFFPKGCGMGFRIDFKELYDL